MRRERAAELVNKKNNAFISTITVKEVVLFQRKHVNMLKEHDVAAMKLLQADHFYLSFALVFPSGQWKQYH
jgi:hypothetical protein